MTALNLHATQARSRANGPGVRFTVWVQGCSLGCVGCFNAPTHDPQGANRVVAAEALIDEVLACDGLDGISVSGGEPFEQPEALLALVRGMRARSPLSILVFSGFARAEIEALPLGSAILASIDVLIDGRYVRGEHHGTGLRGSANQQVHLLTARYTRAEVEATPEGDVRILPDGTVEFSGVAPLMMPGRRR